MIRLVYIIAGLLALILQIVLFDGTRWYFIALPLTVILLAYLRQGVTFALILGVFLMWLWDLQAFFFGWKALIILLVIGLVRLLNSLFFSEDSLIGLFLLVVCGLVSFHFLTWLQLVITFGWRYYLPDLNLLLAIFLGLMIAAVVIISGNLSAKKFHQIVNR